MPKPLDRITVVDLTRNLPGPYCTRLLADLGADVVKIEPPHGDPMRNVAWFAGPNFSSGMYEWLNVGKQIITLDLRDQAAREELHTLLARAGVCVEGFKPATAREIGVDGAALAARYPDLVHCSISGYGQTGARANRAAHDVNYQAEAGLLAAVGLPQAPGLLIADITAAFRDNRNLSGARGAARGHARRLALRCRACVGAAPPAADPSRRLRLLQRV